MTVTGVRSSCETSATKSRRMASTRAISVMSRTSSIFCRRVRGTSCRDRVFPGALGEVMLKVCP